MIPCATPRPRHAYRPRLLPLQQAVQAALRAAWLLPALGAGNALAQDSDDPEFRALTEPKRSMGIGVIASSKASAKANEYSGLREGRVTPVLELDLRGGGRYDSEDATRWRVLGSRLGTDSPAFDLQYGVQGRYRFDLNLEGLRHQLSDSYQTPYLGVGSTTLTLPAGWRAVVVPQVSATAPNARGLAPAVTASPNLVNGVAVAPTAAQAAAAKAVQDADLPAFLQTDLFTQRDRVALSWTQQIGLEWQVTASASHEHKRGLTAIGAPSRATGGDTSSIVPLPVDQDDSKLQIGVAYTSEFAHWQASLETSNFVNHVPSLRWSLWAAPTQSVALSTAPSNQFIKLSLSGGLRLGEQTQLQAAASHSRGTQNEAYLNDSTAPWVPATSAHAVVVTDQLSLKAFTRANKQLSLSAGYQFDQRDNRTPVQLYGYYDLNNPANGTSPFAYLFPTLSGLGANFNINANTPYSRRTHQFNLGGDLNLGQGQHLKLAAEAQQTDRQCHGSWINCADAPHSSEGTVKLDWRGTLGEGLEARAGVSTAQRRVDYDENAFLAVVPMAGQSPSTATGALAGTSAYSILLALGLTGYGPVSGLNPAAAAGSAQGFYFPLNNVLSNALYGNGNRISELIGLRRYNQADRQRDKLRAALTWQANEQWHLQANLDGHSDRYQRSVYGLQRVEGWGLHLDTSYTPHDKLMLNLFGSHDDQRTRAAGNSYTANSAATNVNGATAISGGCFATIALRNANNKTDPCLDWQANTHDLTSTLGASGTWSGLLGGRLALSAQAVYSKAKNRIEVRGGSYVNNPLAGVASAASRDTAAFFVPATALPENTVKSIDLLVAGQWRLGAKQVLRLSYGYQRLSSNDWALEGLQDGSLTQLLPTRELAPRYEVHRVGLAYWLDF